MSQLVKTKRQANFKVLSDLEPLRGSSNKKTLYSTRSCVNWAFFDTRVLKWPTRAKKGPIYTQTRNRIGFLNKMCSAFWHSRLIFCYIQFTKRKFL
jgi:hypothetical protein